MAKFKVGDTAYYWNGYDATKVTITKLERYDGYSFDISPTSYGHYADEGKLFATEDEASLAGRTIELVSSIESLCEAIADRAAHQSNKYGPDVGTSSHLVNIARDKLTQTILDILRPKT